MIEPAVYYIFYTVLSVIMQRSYITLTGDKMSFAGQTMLVTGGAGFVGSMLVRLLLDAGATVRVVDNLVNGKRANLADIANHPCLSLHLVDIRDTQSMQAL